MMPEFTRIAWLDEFHRDIWGKRISEYNKVLTELEVDTVYSMERQAAIVTVPAEQLVSLYEEVSRKNLSASVVGSSGRTTVYSNGSQPVVPGQPVDFRVIVYKGKIDREQLDDDIYVGALLGYPECCVKHFHRFWTLWQEKDPTYTQYSAVKFLIWKYHAHVALRQMGIRLVSHLPCHFHCEESNKIGLIRHRRILLEYPSVGINIYKLLNMPMKWSRLHGIAEVVTPIFKFATSSDHTDKLEEFTIDGKDMVKFTEAEWKQNGFSSLEAMERAHDPVIMAFMHITNRLDTTNPKVIDYGCGNGALLEKFEVISPGTLRYGVDLVDSAITRAEQRLPSGNFAVGNMFSGFFSGVEFDITIVSINRLMEVPADTARLFIHHLKKHSKFTIFTDYNPSTFIGISLARFGVTATGKDHRAFFQNNSCQALVIEW